jgi:6-phosphogluconolactonase
VTALLAALAAAAVLLATGCGQAAASLTAAPQAGAAVTREATTLAFVLAGGRLQTHEVDPATGRFRLLASAEARTCARLSVDPGGRFVFCSDASGFSTFAVDKDGALHPRGSRSTGQGRWSAPRLALHPSGRLAFAAQHQAGLETFAVEPDGVLTSLGSFPHPAGAQAEDAAVHPSGGWLLAVTRDVQARSGEAEVVSYRIDPSGGTPAPRAALRVRDVREIEMDPSGRFLWGIDPGAGAPTIWAAAFDAATGAVRAVEREPAGWRPMDLQLAGRFLYVANRDSNDVWGYGVDPATGALHALGRVAQLEAARALAADPEGRFLYGVGRWIDAFRREDGGRLVPLGRVAGGRAVVLARRGGAAS